MLASVAYAIVIPINFKIKKVGPSIGLGLLLSLVLYSANQELIKTPEYHKFLKYTPLGQSTFIFSKETIGNFLFSIAIVILWSVIFILISHLLFNNDELK